MLRIAKYSCPNGEPSTTASTPRSITSFACVRLLERKRSSATRTLPRGHVDERRASECRERALEPARQLLLVKLVLEMNSRRRSDPEGRRASEADDGNRRDENQEQAGDDAAEREQAGDPGDGADRAAP